MLAIAVPILIRESAKTCHRLVNVLPLPNGALIWDNVCRLDRSPVLNYEKREVTDSELREQRS